ncbi:unnamed protein product, partial [Medioppia subpectinata]
MRENKYNGNGVLNGNTLSDGKTADTFLFSSESVGEGHPDKLCDQLSDAILDAHLKQDPLSRVACETATKSGQIVVLGEITSTANVDIEQVVRDTVRSIGYDDKSKGLDYKSAKIMVLLDKQAQEIASGVHVDRTEDDIGAGDQGLMFGYATDETDECMPLTVVLSHKLNEKLGELRRDGTFPWCRPDCKTQVTCEYYFDNGRAVPTRVHTVVVSTQHSEDISLDELRKEILEKVVLEVIPA